MFKRWQEKQIEKYQNKLKQKNFSESEIKALSKLFSLCKKLTLILFFSIVIVAISAILFIIYREKILDNKILIWTLSTIISVFTIFYHVITLYLFIRVLFNKEQIVKKKIKIWAFLSILPGIGFIFFFIMKRILAWIYKFKK